MSIDVDEELRYWGWYPGRHIDLQGIDTFLRTEGYEINPAATEFLQEFGNLIIMYPMKSGLYDRMYLSPQDAPGLCLENVEAYIEHFGVTMCPIGWADDGFKEILMTPAGRVYIVHCQRNFIAGESGRGAIENMVCGRDLIEIT